MLLLQGCAKAKLVDTRLKKHGHAVKTESVRLMYAKLSGLDRISGQTNCVKLQFDLVAQDKQENEEILERQILELSVERLPMNDKIAVNLTSDQNSVHALKLGPSIGGIAGETVVNSIAFRILVSQVAPQLEEVDLVIRTFPAVRSDFKSQYKAGFSIMLRLKLELGQYKIVNVKVNQKAFLDNPKNLDLNTELQKFENSEAYGIN